MILVDTSAWVDFFRGQKPICDKVDALLESDDVAICGPIITEIRRGLKSSHEKSKIISLFEGCALLDQPANLWDEAGELGFFLSRKGVTVKTLDLLIVTFALSHSTPILSKDKDFDMMKKAGLSIYLA